MPYRVWFFLLATILLLSLGAIGKEVGKMGAFMITSPAFRDNGTIPRQYTCDGRDVNPPLVIENVPGGTRSLALIVDDPDAPDPARW